MGYWGGYIVSGTDAVRLWVNEKPYYDYNFNTCVGGVDCLHYTQIIWRNSLRVGCAKVTCNNGGVFVTCNYDPPCNNGKQWIENSLSLRYDGDEGRNRGDAEVAVAAPLAAFLHTPLDVQELKANKEELRVEKLKDKEEVDDLTQEMAKLRYRTLIPRPQASSL
ncbi:hypothetical protein Ahy_B10g100827 [Arachis hypogaea]|uniref:SCP domain-containing protein n=1 Tax=Arachis hypogaea TaxID=3818 RepID=A0A444WXR8_ARAHY|nr:hypothetical protein Ahy_B10g100827 [Arachis hypogaea]